MSQIVELTYLVWQQTCRSLLKLAFSTCAITVLFKKVLSLEKYTAFTLSGEGICESVKTLTKSLILRKRSGWDRYVRSRDVPEACKDCEGRANIFPTVVILQLRVRGFTRIDALDACQRFLDKSKEDGIYDEYICGRLDESKTNIEDSESSTQTFAHVTFCLEGMVRVDTGEAQAVLRMRTVSQTNMCGYRGHSRHT